VTTIRCHVPRDVDGTVRYQRYYLLGLGEVASVSLEGLLPLVRLVPGADRRIRAIYELHAGRLARLGRALGARTMGHVGRYEAELPGGTVRFAIDAHDGREIRDPDACEWSDVYFKANLWPDHVYPPHVVPIVNGNGLLNRRYLALLRSLRGRPKKTDVVFISNVWGGREHNVRLFEELARLDCVTDLLAIFQGGFDEDETRAYMERLERAGVPTTRAPLAPTELWRRLARAKLVVFRAGKHLCVPWRMLDLLCMGACVVFDSPPPARWPVPLAEGRNYVDCGIERPLGTEPAPAGHYARIVPTIERVLADEPFAVSIREANATYFDHYAAPARVADYVLETIASG
jgi:hypothetical protein